MRRLTIALMLTLSACIPFTQHMRQLELGMERADVERILGVPDGVAQAENQVVLTYANRYADGWGSHRADYHVVFDGQGRVVAYGQGEVRKQGTGGGVVIIR